MDISARDVHEKQFHDAWRGYNQEEVDDFLDRVAEALDRIQRENEQLHERIRELDQHVAASREAEEMLKKTLVTAQRAAEEAIAKAKAKAAELISDAEERVRTSEAEAQERIRTADAESRRKTQESERDVTERTRRLDERIQHLKGFEVEARRRLRAFFEQQLATLDALSESEEPSAPPPAGPPRVQPQFGGPAGQTHASPARPRDEGEAAGGETAEFETPSPHPSGPPQEQADDDDEGPERHGPFFTEG